MKKQVLFFIDSLGCGGAERSLVSLLPLLDYTKIDVDLIIRGRGGVFERYVPDCVNILDYTDNCNSAFDKCMLKVSGLVFSAALRFNKYFLKGRFNPPHLEWATRRNAIKSLPKKYDVAIAYGQGFATYYIMDKINASKKYAWLNVDIYKTKHKLWYVKKFYDRYDGVVAVSDALYDSITSKGLVSKDKAHCIYDILNTDFIVSQSDEAPESLNVNDKRITITTVGRMVVSSKGQDLAVKAARIIKDKGCDFRWYLVGDGIDYDSIKEMIKQEGLEDNVFAVGLQPNPFPFVKAADIYVQTSRFEGFGLTLTEAKILGKPVVTTDFPAAYNQFVDGESGLIVGMNAQEIADAVLRLINDKSLRENMAKKNSTYVNETQTTEAKKVMSLIMA